MMMIAFMEAAQKWKADKRPWVKKSTYATYVQLLQAHLLPFFGTLQRPDGPSIQEYVNRQLAKGLSVKTVKDSLMVLKMILRFGEREYGWPHLEYEVHFPPSAGEKTRIPVLSPREQRQLTAYLRKHFSFRNLGVLLCLYGGLRIGEVCALQWKDIDTATGVLHVSKTVQRIWLKDGAEKVNTLWMGTPKTASSRRDIPLTRELLSLLKPLKKLIDQELFVVSNAATPMEPRYYRNYFRKLLADAGLPPLRFHALRHSFATRCIESRCDYKTVSLLLGHASLSTTLDLYVHMDLAEKKRCIDRMSRKI